VSVHVINFLIIGVFVTFCDPYLMDIRLKLVSDITIDYVITI